MSLENKLEQATGAIKEGFGKVTGDSKTEAEGTVEKTVAKAKEVVEDVHNTDPITVAVESANKARSPFTK